MCLFQDLADQGTGDAVGLGDLGQAHAGAHPLDDQVLFQLGDGADDDDHGAAERATSIEILPEADVLDIQPVQLIEALPGSAGSIGPVDHWPRPERHRTEHDGRRSSVDRVQGVLPWFLAHTIRHVSDILRHLQRFTDAEMRCAEALALDRKGPNAPPLDLANAVRSMAVLKKSLGADGEAEALWEEAQKVYASLGVQARVDESRVRLAEIARKNEQ